MKTLNIMLRQPLDPSAPRITQVEQDVIHYLCRARELINEAKQARAWATNPHWGKARRNMEQDTARLCYARARDYIRVARGTRHLTRWTAATTVNRYNLKMENEA